MHRIFIVLVLIKLVNCGTLYPPHIISQSSSVLDDNSAIKNNGVYSDESQKGISSIEEANGIKKEHETKHISGQDSGSYNHENAQKNKKEDAGQREEEKFHQQNYDSLNKVGRKGGHKKGHHKTGFHNTYHKDESENKSSFYDDNDDEGGHFTYNAQNGVGAQNGGDRFKESYDNGRYDNKHDNKKGFYDVNGNYGNEKGDKSAYDEKKYYNDRRDQRNSNVGNTKGEAGVNYEESKYYKHPHYNTNPIYRDSIYRQPDYNDPNYRGPYYRDPYYREPYYREPYYRRYEPKKTITVYEDPRMYQRGYSDNHRPYERRYDAGYVNLDFRRPTTFRSPIYDYYRYK